MGVVTRVNAPYAAIRVLTGQQMSEVINVWLKKLQFVAKGFSLGAFYSVPLIFQICTTNWRKRI